MAVYDPEKEKTYTPSHSGEHDDLGTHPERREAEVADLERQFDAPSANKNDTEKEETNRLTDDDNDSWETSVDDDSGDGKRKRFRITGKQAAAGGGVAAVLIGGGMGMFMIFGGPFELVHLGQVLDKFSIQSNRSISNRIGKLFKHSGRSLQSGEIGETRVSRIGSKRFHEMRERLEARGVTFNDSGGFLTSVDIDIDEHPDYRGRSASTEQKRKWAADALNVPENLVTEIGSSSEFRVDVGSDIALKRVVGRAVGESVASGEFGSAANFRQFTKWFGLPSLFHPYERTTATVRENVAVRSRAKALEREQARQGTKRGKTIEKLEAARSNLNEKISPDTKTSIARGLLLADAVCTFRDIKDGVDQFNQDAIVEPSQVASTEMRAAGSQLEASIDVNLVQMGDTTKTFTDDDGKTIWQGQSLNALATDSAGKGVEIDNGYKLAFLPGTFSAFVDGFIDNPATGVVCSPAGKAIQFVAGVGTFIVSGGASGGALKVGFEVVEMAGKSVVMSAALGAVQGIANDQFGGEAVKQFSGPQGGNLFAYGARSAQNIASIAMGGIALKGTNSRIAEATYENDYRQEFQQRSFAERMFNINDYRSVAGSFAMSLSKGSVTNGRSLISNLSLGKILGNIGSIMSPRVAAQTEGYDWGFAVYGMPSTVLDDPKYDNPYENAEKVAGFYKNYEEKIKTCFGASFTSSNGLSVKNNTVVDPNSTEVQNANCDDTSDENWVRTFLFVFDNAVVTQVDCWEGSDSSCAEIGLDGATTSNTSGSSGITGVELPPNLGPEVGNGYYLMPEAPNGEYVFSNPSAEANHYGSKELIGAIYTVAKKWHEKYPNSRLRIGDLNARGGHLSHTTGVDVDITTEDKSAAQVGGNAEMSKELGRMFADTGIIKLIYYNDKAVQDDVNAYAASKGVTADMQNWTGHENHFHVRVKDDYKLQAGGQP